MTIVEHDSPFPADIDADRDGRVDDIDDLPDDGVEYSGELVPFDEAVDLAEPWRNPLRGPVEQLANRPLPSLASMRNSAEWWAVQGGKASLNFVVHSPQLALTEIPRVWAGFGRWAETYSNWRLKPDWRALTKGSDAAKAARDRAEVERHTRNATRITWVVIALVLGGALAAHFTGYDWTLAVAGALVLLRADAVGRKARPTQGVAIMPQSSFRKGAPSAMVMNDVHAVLIREGHDELTTVVTEPRVGPYGMTMQIHSTRAIEEGTIGAIERGLQTFRGAVSVAADPDNAAVHTLSAFWSDPLAIGHVPPAREPLSQTVSTPAELGYGVGGTPLLLNFKRTNVLLVGGPGSGKSSALWSIIDWLSTCHDVVLHALDLSGGPMANAWGDTFASIATTKAEARALLECNIARAIARTNYLADRSRPSEDPDRVIESENWESSDGLFHITIIDELPLLAADPDLRALYAEHQRIGRKAGDTSVAATQDLNGDTLGATSLRKYPSTTILFACSREDVTAALGGGKIKEGWTPHRFTPAEGDSPNDAGKCYVKSGRHTKPLQWRFSRLDDIGEIHRRAIERIRAGRPTDEHDPVAVDDVEIAVEVPQVLVDLAKVFADAGNPEFLPSAEVLAAMADYGTAKALAAALDPYGVTTSRQRVEGRANAVHGYRRADVERAQADLQ